MWMIAIASLVLWTGEKVVHSNSEWKEILGHERYQVMREKGTERAFLGKYVSSAEEGVFVCAACQLPLFLSDDKYDIGSGWPCFKKPLAPQNIYYLEDWRLKFKRYEVLCRRCDSHLGHVFHDGPPPKFLRYTINSLSIHLNPKK